MPAAGMTREEAVLRVAEKMAEEYFDDQEVGPVTHYVEPILREFERATLERAAKATCLECRRHDPTPDPHNLSIFFHSESGVRWHCEASAIRALMEEV